MAEINVTPLVDVVLVLLIIFMVTASAMEFGLEIDVPKVKTASRSVEDAPVVSIDNTSRVFLLEKPTNINQLAAAIQRQFPKAKDVYLRSDKNVKVDQLMQVVGALAEAKLNVKLVTRSENIKK